MAVPLTLGEVKVALTEACQAGIFAGLSIVPLSVSNSTVTSSGTRIGIPLLSSILMFLSYPRPAREISRRIRRQRLSRLLLGPAHRLLRKGEQKHLVRDCHSR